MKVEIAESLVLSWLKHDKNCQIVQLNWRPSSDHWADYNRSRLEKLAADAREMFQQRLEMDIFKKSNVDQLTKQAEIDALGIRIEGDGQWYLYSVDVAFHENGLGYRDNVPNVMMKLVRMALCITRFFNTAQADLVFASPIIRTNDADHLSGHVNELNAYFDREGFKFKSTVIGNEDFRNIIFNSVINRSAAVSDTSELFLRSVRLLETVESLQNRRSTKQTGADASIKEGELGQNDLTTDEIKVGALVQKAMADLSSRNLLSDDLLNSLKAGDYSRQHFGLNFPVLKAVDSNLPLSEQRKVRGYNRYYATVYTFHGQQYLLCNNWMPESRQRFVFWLDALHGDHRQ